MSFRRNRSGCSFALTDPEFQRAAAKAPIQGGHLLDAGSIEKPDLRKVEADVAGASG